MIRLCVGIEHVDDIIADLDQALAAAVGPLIDRPASSRRSAVDVAVATDHRAAPVGRSAREPRAAAARSACVNNMPDAALCGHRAAVRDLLAAAAGSDFASTCASSRLPSVRRGDDARRAMDGRYASPEALQRSGADGLIVTGLSRARRTCATSPTGRSSPA